MLSPYSPLIYLLEYFNLKILSLCLYSILKQVQGTLLVQVSGPKHLLNIFIVQVALGSCVCLLKNLLLEALHVLLRHPVSKKHLHDSVQVLLIYFLVSIDIEDPKINLKGSAVYGRRLTLYFLV